MAHSKVLLTFSAIIFVLPLILLASPVPVHAANIAVSPSSGTVSASVHVSGDGFSGRSATIYWDQKVILRMIPISDTGELEFDFQVPTACRGSHTIRITDDSNWTSSTASTTFTVLPGIEIFPQVGNPYSSITVIGNGFSCFERDIKVTWDKTALPVPTTANNFGAWSISFNAPETAKGEHYISAFSGSTEASEIGEHKFIVGPFAKIDSSSGPVGTEVEMQGFGFRTSEDGITITWDNQIIVCNLIAGTDGVLDTKLNIPPTTQGHHLLGLFGSDFTPKGIIPDMSFNVIPNIQLQPASGNKGTKVTINGTGFSKDETITFSFEGADLNTNVIADSKGSFNTFFITPQSSTKDNNVKAVGTAGNSAETIFIIDKVTPPAPVLVSPQQGAKLALFGSVGDVLLGTAKQLLGIISFQNSNKRGFGPPSVSFDWSDVKVQGKTSYTLEIANTNDFSSPAVLKKGLINSEYDLSKDDTITLGSYSWRVRAVDDIGNEGLWSEANKFEVIPMSNSVLILSLVIPLVFISGMAILGIMIWRRHRAGM